MAAELGLVSLTQLQLERIAATQQLNHLNNPNPSSLSSSSSSAWMWNPKQQTKEDDESWEVRAFEEDAGNIMGTTWPPRSYTCTFCRREFRSAQALGGHMNVHRRDRARLHQTPSNYQTPSSSSTYTSSSSTFIIPPQQFSSNGGLCLLYQLPNPNAVFSSTAINACPINSPSTLLSVSQYPHNHHHQIASRTVINSSQFYSNCKAEPATSILDSKEFVNEEEVDLELRLGHRSTSTSSSSPY